MKKNKVAWRKCALTAAVLSMILAGGAMTAFAAPDNGAGTGNGVAIGTGSNAPKAENVAIGKGAGISYSNGASNATGDIAIGNGSHVNNYASQGGSIALGSNAKVENMAGGMEAAFAFGQTTYSGGMFSSARIPADPTKAVTAIAMGQNTFARSGSLMIGTHNYKGALGDTTVDTSNTRKMSLQLYSTTLGTNSFNNGAFATVTGAYNIASSAYDGGRLSAFSEGMKNFGATIYGALNSIESMSGSSNNGIANTITGVANRTQNANGAIIIGAGNEITNSYKAIGVSSSGAENANSAKAFADAIRDAVKQSQSGGAVLAVGGGNTIDNTLRSQVLGVNNRLQGTSGQSEEVLVNGVGNEGDSLHNTTIIGTGNKASQTRATQLLGDKRKLTGVQNSVILGSADSEMELTVSKATILGYNANVQAEGGVALGAGSVLNATESGLDQSGYDALTRTNSTETGYIWRPTLAAVSVGVSGTDTRRITNVAAGINDTDAVNVAQLKRASGNLIAGDGIKLVKGTDGSWTISTNFKDSGSDKVTYEDTTPGGGAGTGGTGTGDPLTGKAAVIETKLTADDGNTTSLGANDKLGVKGDGTNITTSVDGSDVHVSLNKDIQVDSVTINNNGPVLNSDGINMQDKKITNVQDGDVYAGSKDVVNGGQLWDLQNTMGGRISRLDTKINRVGAGAAAMANLHPLDFNPEEKWSFATGFGNYRNSNALAIGTFYRPDDKTMFSLSGTFGNGENMLGAGVSFQLDRNMPASRETMAKTITNLKAQVAEQQAALQAQNDKIAALEKMVSQLAQSK